MGAIAHGLHVAGGNTLGPLSAERNGLSPEERFGVSSGWPGSALNVSETQKEFEAQRVDPSLFTERNTAQNNTPAGEGKGGICFCFIFFLEQGLLVPGGSHREKDTLVRSANRCLCLIKTGWCCTEIWEGLYPT